MPNPKLTPGIISTLTSMLNGRVLPEIYKEIKEEFANDMQIPIKIVINKMDFATEEEISNLLGEIQVKREDVIKISAKTGENVDTVKKYLLNYFHSTNYSR